MHRSRKNRSASSTFPSRRIARKSSVVSFVRQSDLRASAGPLVLIVTSRSFLSTVSSSFAFKSAIVVACYHDRRKEGTLSTFELLAAIDLRDGKVVRLVQGEFARETVYGDDPIATAAKLLETGVPWLHIVDLDGARAGAPRQTRLLGDIVAALGREARCQVAGGLRTEAAVEAALETGAARVVVGTAALEQPSLAGRLVERWGVERIGCAIDVRDGMAVGYAWQGGESGYRAEDSVHVLAATGVRRFVVTSIERDGLMEGPDLDLLERLVRLDAGAVIASGGIASIDHLLAVRGLGCPAGQTRRAGSAWPR